MASMRRAYQRAASSTSSIGGILSRPSPSALNANDQGLLFALELFPKHATHPYLFSAMTGMFVQAHQIPKDQMLTSGMPADEVLEGARQSLARVQELLAEGDTDGLKGLTGNRLHDLLSEHQKESAWLGLYGKQLEMKCEGSPMSNLFATFFMTHDPTPMSSFVDTPLGVSGWDGVTKAFMDRFVGPLLLWGHRAVGGHMRVAVKEQRRVLLAGKGAGGPGCAPLALTSKRYGEQLSLSLLLCVLVAPLFALTRAAVCSSVVCVCVFSRVVGNGGYLQKMWGARFRVSPHCRSRHGLGAAR
jgi:hypothetical protein